MSRHLARSARLTAAAVGIAATGLVFAGTAGAAPAEPAEGAQNGGPATEAPASPFDAMAMPVDAVGVPEVPSSLPSYSSLPTGSLPVELPGLTAPLDATQGIGALDRGTLPGLATDDVLGSVPLVSELPGLEIVALPTLPGQSAPAEAPAEARAPGSAEAQRDDVAAPAAEEAPETVTTSDERNERIVTEDVVTEGRDVNEVTETLEESDDDVVDNEIAQGDLDPELSTTEAEARDSALSSIERPDFLSGFGG